MMVASGEWARWRGPQEKEYRGGAHRRKIPSSGRGGGQRVVVLVSRHQQPHAHARTRPPLPGPAGARPCRPTVVARAAVVLSPRTSASLHQHHLLRQRTLHRLVPVGMDAFRHIWFVSRPGPPCLGRPGPPCLGRPGPPCLGRPDPGPLVLQQPPDEKPFRYV